AGTVLTRSGPFMATEDSINVTVHGKGGHGAIPQHTIDPVVIAAMAIVRLQTIVSESQAAGSPRDPDFAAVGSFPLTVNDPPATDRAAAGPDLQPLTEIPAPRCSPACKLGPRP
ncbi:MAG TPA: hypothetical protein VHT94_12460, partial [Streptosporangiaceae bacterium]|nr:hypothetical protein [Streptosporangiaceae bacterium]